MRALRPRFLGLLLLAISGLALADPHGRVVPGALGTIEGKVSQWPVPAPQVARDPIPDADGNVYFVVAGAHKIVRFDPRSRQFKEWGLPDGTKPHGIVITRGGKVFFGGNANGTLGELDTASGAIRSYPTSSTESHPYSLALDADDNVWITERAAGLLAKLDRATGIISEHPMNGEPYGLVFDRRGILWVTRIAADKLSSFDPKTGKTTELFMGAGTKPRRVGLAPDGMLWVSLYGSGKLVKVDPAANRVIKEYLLPGGANTGPYSVNVDALGRVWVAQFQVDSVAILDPKKEEFRVIRLPDRNSGLRNAAIDAQGRYWYIATTTGKLGLIE